jgi:uncharacterized protein (DUF697 family)
MPALPVKLGVLRGLVKELQVSERDEKPLVVGGARELVPVLRRELGVRGGDDPRGAAVYVHVLGGPRAASGGPADGPDAGGFAAGVSSRDDEASLKRARRARVPIVAVASKEVDAVPYVLATDVVHVRPGEGFPVEQIARAIARRLGEDAAPLAARVPVLRRAVAEHLIASFAAKNGIVGAAVFVPGADLPVLALNQVRLVLRLEQAYGLRVDPRERAPEILASLGAGVGLRALARELLDVVPVAGWAVKGAVAYAGTRALGEATLRRLEVGAPRGHAATPPPAGASRDGP